MISCSTSQECWVTLRNFEYYLAGTPIFATTNGGETWTSQAIPPAQISDISCPTSQNCYAAGTFYSGSSNGSRPTGIILATSNGGSTWVALDLPPATGPLVSIACTGPTSCRALGTPPPTYDLAYQENAFTLSTSDSTIWYYQQLPVGTSALSSVSCPTSQNCWAVGQGSILATTDGGTTWLGQTLPQGIASITSISCPSVSSCWAVGLTADYSSGAVIATVDGGTQWSIEVIQTNLNPVAISCSSTNDCWVVGSDTEYGIPTVIATTDGGAYWTPQEIPAQASVASLSSVSCVGALDCWAVGTSSRNSIPAIVSTTNGGTTWSAQSMPSSADYLTSLTAISCISSNRCWAVGGNENSPSTPIEDSNEVLYTTDGGLTWNMSAIPGFSQNSSISCVSSGGCWIINGSQEFPSGAIITNANGTWAIELLGTLSSYLTSISCSDTLHCWAVGATAQNNQYQLPAPGETIIATSNGGGTSTVHARSNGYWLVSANGAVYAFGGAAFYGSLSAANLVSPIVAIASTPDGEGYWLVSSDGGVFAFGDANFYGSLSGTGLGTPITGIAPTPNGKGYALVGSDGSVFEFGNANLLWVDNPSPVVGSYSSVVGIQSSPDGLGYWTISNDALITEMGDSSISPYFFGQQYYLPNGTSSVVGAASTPDGAGAWIVASDGGVFAIGDALFYGSLALTPHSGSIVGITSASNGKGYWLASSNGGVYAFGSAFFYGSVGSVSQINLQSPIVGIAAD